MTKIHLNLGERGYDINVGRGLLAEAGKYFDLARRVLILTDSGVPREYAEAVASQCSEARIVTVAEGEGSKSISSFERVLSEMVDFGMTRTDCAVAVGGGVVGDLCGFVAASYMRGIDFYNIPTTVLSQIDSSIGGKVAVNLGGVKNIVGAFYQPKGVLIDPEVLKTLPKRQISNGLCEAVKMALTSDSELFSLFEREEIGEDNIERVIISSLMIKKQVVEEDERESGLRRILNFGHTFGHAVEGALELSGYYHGECVAIGMTVVCSDAVRARLIPVLKRLNLPTEFEGDLDGALGFIKHDKKCEGKSIHCVFVDSIGSFRIEKMSTEAFCELVRERVKK